MAKGKMVEGSPAEEASESVSKEKNETLMEDLAHKHMKTKGMIGKEHPNPKAVGPTY